MRVLLLFLLLAALPVAAQDDAFETFEVPLNANGYDLDVSPDGRYAAVYENSILLGAPADLFNIPIRLIDLQTGEEAGVFLGHSDFAADFAFTLDGTRAASFHTNGDVHLWDVETQESLAKFETLQLGGGRLQFLADGQTLVLLTSGMNSRLLYLDTETGAITRILGRHFLNYDDFRDNYTAPPANFSLIYSAFAASPDGRFAAAATANDEVILFNLETGREQTIRQPSEEMAQLSIRRMEFIGDGEQLIYHMRGEPGTIHIWDVEAGEEVLVEEMGAEAWDYRDGVLAFVSREDGVVRAVRITATETLLNLPVPESVGRVSLISTLALTPDALILGGLSTAGDENVLIRIALEAGN